MTTPPSATLRNVVRNRWVPWIILGLALATTASAYPYHPSQLLLYDVSRDDTWLWIGGVALGTRTDPPITVSARATLAGLTQFDDRARGCVPSLVENENGVTSC